MSMANHLQQKQRILDAEAQAVLGGIKAKHEAQVQEERSAMPPPLPAPTSKVELPQIDERIQRANQVAAELQREQERERELDRREEEERANPIARILDHVEAVRALARVILELDVDTSKLALRTILTALDGQPPILASSSSLAIRSSGKRAYTRHNASQQASTVGPPARISMTPGAISQRERRARERDAVEVRRQQKREALAKARAVKAANRLARK